MIEGSNNHKQVVEVYTEDGRPFICSFCVNRTPGALRIVNTAPVNIPIAAKVVAVKTEPKPETAKVAHLPGSD